MFNGGLNCVVGPNHAGKSAVFDFVRFALELDRDSPGDSKEKLLSRLNAILGQEGAVELIVRSEATLHVLRRTFRPQFGSRDKVAVPSDVPERTQCFRYNAESDVLEPCAAPRITVELYEQGRIHRLRDDIPRQLEMLDSFAGLNGMRAERVSVLTALSESASEIKPLREKYGNLQAELAELPALRKELASLEALLPNQEDEAPWANACDAASALKSVSDQVTALIERITKSGAPPGWDEEDPLWNLFNITAPIVDLANVAEGELLKQWQAEVGSAIQDLSELRGRVLSAGAKLREAITALEMQWICRGGNMRRRPAENWPRRVLSPRKH